MRGGMTALQTQKHFKHTIFNPAKTPMRFLQAVKTAKTRQEHRLDLTFGVGLPACW